jgi:aspartate/glutamate racemase
MTLYKKAEYKNDPNLTEHDNLCAQQEFDELPLSIICEHGNKITIDFITECWDAGADIVIEGCEECAKKHNLTSVKKLKKCY